MAENVAAMRVEETTVIATGAKHGRGPGQRVSAYGVVAALLVALLIGGITLHDRNGSHTAAPAIPHIATSVEMRFLENNTTNLPNAVTAAVRPVVSSEQQKFLDLNTVWLPALTAEVAPSAMTSNERRLLEVNTTMMPIVVGNAAGNPAENTQGEEFTPIRGHEQVAISLAQPVVAKTGLWPSPVAGTGLWP